MKVTAVLCPNCRVVLYTRSQYDFLECRCKKFSIQGSQSSLVMGGNGLPLLIEVPAEHNMGFYAPPWPNWLAKQMGFVLINKVADEIENSQKPLEFSN